MRQWLLVGAMALVLTAQAAEPQAGKLCQVAAANPFRAHSWLPPPPPPPPPPTPKAPPLPFTYLGQVEDGTRIRLFLSRQEGTLIVGEGDTIDGTWQVAEVVPTRATFLYLPLNESQQLVLRSRP